MLRRTIPDEVILTGQPDAVASLLQAAGTQVSGMSEHKAYNVSHQGRNLRLGLVRLAKETRPGSVGELMVALSRSARDNHINVAMEPNCAIGNPFRSELNPWEWDVNPWEWDVNPWEWDVNPSIPAVVPAGATPAEGEALFWSQPAFQAIGLTDAAGVRAASLAAHQGAGVVVGIFDALPKIAINQPWLTLHPSATPLQSPADGPVRDLSDHGLMCASLVHGVAPAAEVHLYEVCTSDGSGTLYPLLEGLSAFIAMAAGRPAIISLSLGSMCCGIPSPALSAVLRQATDLGMVVCAAAGNRGKASTKVSTVPSAQIPAALPNVIAVSASNLSLQRATYSQRGDLAAPGGEDLGAHGPDDAEDIIGMGNSLTGYVRMDAGTSFSTPLVAGTAALLVEKVLATGGALSATTYSQVLASLTAGCQAPAAGAGETLPGCGLGGGILNLRGLLA